MTINDKLVKIGQTPNDRTGDNLRTAFNKVNNLITDFYSSPGGTRGSVQNLGDGNVTLTADQITGNILTADPGYADRVLTLPAANTGAGFRLVLINRGTSHHITVQDPSLNIILVAEPQESWELVCDGYTWTVLY